MAKKKDIEKYTIRIEVRDENGNLIVDEDGVKRISLRYELEIHKDSVEWTLRDLSRTLKTWMPDRQITIEAMVHNSISGTYMTMFSFYGNEDRFVKH